MAYVSHMLEELYEARCEELYGVYLRNMAASTITECCCISWKGMLASGIVSNQSLCNRHDKCRRIERHNAEESAAQEYSQLKGLCKNLQGGYE